MWKYHVINADRKLIRKLIRKLFKNDMRCESVLNELNELLTTIFWAIFSDCNEYVNIIIR